jgi:small subunit ribosomal protein S2
VRDTVAKGGRILFVGTKRQAQKSVAEAAERCAQYLHEPPLAGRHADQLEDRFAVDPAPEASDETFWRAGAEGLTKKERLAWNASRPSCRPRWAASAKWAAPRT